MIKCESTIFMTIKKTLFHVILLGYKYSYPFLSVDSGIHIDDNFVQPLYKQIFNIEHPTMAFIGIPSSAPNFGMFDLQVNIELLI